MDELLQIPPGHSTVIETSNELCISDIFLCFETRTAQSWVSSGIVENRGQISHFWTPL